MTEYQMYSYVHILMMSRCTTQVHDDSSQSGSRSINSPKKDRYGTSGSEDQPNHDDSLDRSMERSRGQHVPGHPAPGDPAAQQGGAQPSDEFNYTYYKLSYDTSHQSALCQNANDNEMYNFDNVSHDSYHLREESADELEQSGDELDRSTGDNTERSTGDKLDRSEGDVLSGDEVEEILSSAQVGQKVFDTVLHIDEEKLMREVREQMQREEEMEVEGEGEGEKLREGVGLGERVEPVQYQQVATEPLGKPGLQETSIDDVMSPVSDVMTSPVKDDVMTSSVTWENQNVRKVEVEIVEKEQEKVYNRTPSIERPPAYNFSRSESEGNESTANERVPVNGNLTTVVPSDNAPAATNVNGNEIPYVLHRRHVEKQQTQQLNGRPSRPLQKQHTAPARVAVAKQQKASRDQARLQLEQIKTDLRSPIVPQSKRSPRDKSPGSGLVRVNKLPPRDSYSYKDDTVSPSSEKEIISQYTIHTKYQRSRSEEHKRTRDHHHASPTKVHPVVTPTREVQVYRVVQQLQQQQQQQQAPFPQQKIAQAPPGGDVAKKKVPPATQQKPTASSSKKQPSPKHKALNDLNKPSPPKKPPRTSSNVESADNEAKQLKLMDLHKQNLIPPKAPKAEMEDLTPTTDTDSDSSGGTGRRKIQPIRGHVRNTSQADSDINCILSDGGEAAEDSSLVSSSSSPGKMSTPGTGSPIKRAGSPDRTTSGTPGEPGSPAKKVDSPVCEESFSAIRGQDLPFADSVPHFSDEDDDDTPGGTGGKMAEGDVSEEDLEDQLNVPGLEQEEFSDMEQVASPESRSPAHKPRAQRAQNQEGSGGQELPPPVPTCPPPESDISSDSEAEKPTDEALPEILSVAGVSNLPPPVPSFDLEEYDEEEQEGQLGSTEIQSYLPPPKLSPEEPGTTGKQSSHTQGQPGGSTGTELSTSPVEPRKITAIPEDPLEYKISPSQPPPVTKFKYVRSDSDVPPPPPPVELLQATVMHDISSEEEVEMPALEREDIPDLEEQLLEGRVVPPPPVAPTEISSGSDELSEKQEEELVDLDQALSSSMRIGAQLIAAELHTVTGKPPPPMSADVVDISSESDVCEDYRTEEMEDLEAALTAGRVPPPVEISSEEEMCYPDDKDSEIHGDIQEALREGRAIVPGTGPVAELDLSESDPEPGDNESLPEIDQFEKKFELHIEEDEESVTCLPEGAEHMITPLEGAGAEESLSSVGRRSSGSTSSESALEMKGAIGGGIVSTKGLPLEISSESDVEGPVVEDLPDPTDILDANVFMNPYMVPDDEFSEHIQELPPPPPPPTQLSSPLGVQDQETRIINQCYGAAPGSMSISGPTGARKPPPVAPKPPKRDSSMQPAAATSKPRRTGYEALDGDESDSDSEGETGGPPGDETDRLEALESLRQPYIVHRSDSSGSDPEREGDSTSSSSEEDFEEIPEAIIRQRQIGRHHVGIDVTNRRYRNQVTMHVKPTDTTPSANQHIYQNVTVTGEQIIAHHFPGEPGQSTVGGSEGSIGGIGTNSAGDSTHIYQNLRATENGSSRTTTSTGESAYQPLQVRETIRSQQQQQQRQQPGGRSPQAEVFSNPFAETFGASTIPSSGEIQSSRSSSQGQSQRSRAGRSGRASNSDSD